MENTRKKQERKRETLQSVGAGKASGQGNEKGRRPRSTSEGFPALNGPHSPHTSLAWPDLGQTNRQSCGHT